MAVSLFARVIVGTTGPTMVPRDSRLSLACLQMATMAAAWTDGGGSGGGANDGGGNGAFLSAQVSQYKKEDIPWGPLVEPPWTLLLVTSLVISSAWHTWLGGQDKVPSDRRHPGHHGQQINHCGHCLGGMRWMASFVCKN